MADGHLEWLENKSFKPAGSWSPGTKKFKPLPSLAATPGIYAFVVDSTIHYIGQSLKVGERIASYGRAFLEEPANRPFREAHIGMRKASNAGKTVEAWALIFDERHANKSLIQLESSWIDELRPVWNVSGPRPIFIPCKIVEQINAWIASQPEPRPSLSEAIRHLLAEALGKPE